MREQRALSVLDRQFRNSAGGFMRRGIPSLNSSDTETFSSFLLFFSLENITERESTLQEGVWCVQQSGGWCAQLRGPRDSREMDS